MIEQNMFDEALIHNNEKNISEHGNPNRKRVHIPFCDVDDLAFKNRHDPTFIANISQTNIRSLLTINTILILSDTNLILKQRLCKYQRPLRSTTTKRTTQITQTECLCILILNRVIPWIYPKNSPVLSQISSKCMRIFLLMN